MNCHLQTNPEAGRRRITGETVSEWMNLFAAGIEQAEPFLTDLDRAIGDGDHGVNMRRGMKSVVSGLETFTPPDLSGHLRAISTLLTGSVGGASGPLYGAFFLQGSHSTLYKQELTLNDLTALVEGGCRGVVQLGKASVGDKTMVDTLVAAVGSLRTSCGRRASIPEALAACVEASRQAAEGTIPMIAKKGRASYLGERSAGFQDPGATSVYLLFESLAQALVSSSSSNPSQQTVLL
jgi:dihydroxyacetone kinase-like protein